MNCDAFGDSLLNDGSFEGKRRLIGAEASWLAQLPLADSAALIDRLYQASVHLRETEKPEQAFECGRLIRRLGAAVRAHDPLAPAHVALGNMVCGDALNAQHAFKRAWIYFERAAWRFDHIGDEFGWARTVIGRLQCAVEVAKADQVINREFARARRIFKVHQDYRRVVVLYLNAAILYQQQTRFEESLRLLKAGLKVARSSRDINQANIPLLRNLIAMIHVDRGDARKAARYYRHIYNYFHKLEHPRQFIILQNLASLERTQGKYRTTLKRLDRLLPLIGDDFPATRRFADRTRIECYLDLNEFRRASNLSLRFLAEPALSESEQAWGNVYLARALAELENYEEASSALDKAQVIFQQLDVAGAALQIRLYRALIALRQGDTKRAFNEATVILGAFQQKGQQLQVASVYLLMASALLPQNKELDMALKYCQETLRIAHQCDSPSHIYSAHVLSGHLLHAAGSLVEAEKAYLSAIHIIDELQRDLTIVLRPTFLGDKGEATRSLIKLYLDQGQVEQAFQALERSKAQVFFECLADADALHWLPDPSNRTIQWELNQLRADYLAFRSKAQEDSLEAGVNEAAQTEAANLKELILNRTRELYNSKSVTDRHALFAPASLAEIQKRLLPDMLLVAYYNDGQNFHAFIIDDTSIEHRMLADSRVIKTHLNHLERQSQIAISAMQWVKIPDDDYNPLLILNDPALNDRRFKTAFDRSAAALYECLIAPWADRLTVGGRLLIAPYGDLHNLPFHLLYRAPTAGAQSARYIIEDFEVVVLPTASLIQREPPKGSPGATVIYDDWNSQLRCSERDAQRVHELFGGSPPLAAKGIDLDALLRAPPTQVLHIIAHGEFDSDNPELSYVQLADQQLMMNDLLQYNLEYEIVTLTACEIGKLKLAALEGRVAVGDDLVGLGRAFLYAGTATVLVSLWLIGDGLTLPLVERFYGALRAGATKAAALRSAQLELHVQFPNLHPVFWGVFQLIGDAGRLSIHE